MKPAALAVMVFVGGADNPGAIPVAVALAQLDRHATPFALSSTLRVKQSFSQADIEQATDQLREAVETL